MSAHGVRSAVGRSAHARAGGPGSAGRSATDAGLFALRATVGLFLAAHGAQKLFGWFSGPGIAGTARFLESIGYDPGKVFAVISGVCEFGGGLALAAGILTPLAGAMILGDMINAAAFKWSFGFFGGGGNGFQYELLLAICGGVLALTGPGRLAIDRFIPALRRHQLGYGAAAVIIGLSAAAITLGVKR